MLVDFSDKKMPATTAHFEELFFSTGVLPHGSVKEYYAEATDGLVDITGDVVGPYRMPHTLAWYANSNFGINRPPAPAARRGRATWPTTPRTAADPPSTSRPTTTTATASSTPSSWCTPAAAARRPATPATSGRTSGRCPPRRTRPTPRKIFAYLTIPEDAKIGVCAHELGHLLFGFPDLYDTDDTSEGIGNWCLMAGGSWNGGGDVPAHPSAWCKANQGWVIGRPT